MQYKHYSEILNLTLTFESINGIVHLVNNTTTELMDVYGKPMHALSNAGLKETALEWVEMVEAYRLGKLTFGDILKKRGY